MQFDHFARRIAELLELDGGSLSLEPTADLYREWGLDSFKAFQLIIAIEALAEAFTPPLDVPELYVLGDAYQYYLDLRLQQD